MLARTIPTMTMMFLSRDRENLTFLNPEMIFFALREVDRLPADARAINNRSQL